MKQVLSRGRKHCKDSQSSGEDGVTMNNYKSLCYIEVGTSLSEDQRKMGFKQVFSHGNKIIINANQSLVGWLCKHLPGGYHLLPDSYLQQLLPFTDFCLSHISKHSWHPSHRRKGFLIYKYLFFFTLFIYCVCVLKSTCRGQKTNCGSQFSLSTMCISRTNLQLSGFKASAFAHWITSLALQPLSLQTYSQRDSHASTCCEVAQVPKMCTLCLIPILFT